MNDEMTNESFKLNIKNMQRAIIFIHSPHIPLSL